jgi:hypothetical protein
MKNTKVVQGKTGFMDSVEYKESTNVFAHCSIEKVSRNFVVTSQLAVWSDVITDYRHVAVA